MQARHLDECGSAIAVVSGIDDELRARGRKDAARQMGRVVAFENRFAPVPQISIAQKEPKAAEAQVLRVRR